MMKRKFSIDIPRLKIMPSKADTRALKDHLTDSSGLDSPPPTPKSVRPPLSPRTDADLRASCALVLQGFKPSHEPVPVRPLPTNTNKPQLDYAAIKELTQWSTDAGPLLSQTISNVQAGNVDDSTRNKARSKSEAIPSARHPQAILRADLLMGPARSTTHSRDASITHPIPQLAPAAPLKIDLVDRPKSSRRQDSVDTAGSTPQTDSTEDPWSERASTAMTSAMVTPARGSKRTSSQATHPVLESGSVPKIEEFDPDWMRLELDRHRKTHEDRAHAEKLDHDQDVTRLSTTKIARKPVPTSISASRQQSVTAPLDSRRKQDGRPSARRQDSHDTQRAAGRPTDRQSGSTSRTASRARSLSRGVKDYFRPPPQPPTNDPPATPSRSRARSISRYVMDHVRPTTAASSRRPSADHQRAVGRSQSVDSTGSATSAAPSLFSNPWRRMSRFYGSGSNLDVSRPESATSATAAHSTSRGRDRTRSLDPSNSKAKADLNRDLPPLPSLDSWKAASIQVLKHDQATDSRDSVLSSSMLPAAPTSCSHKSSMDAGISSTAHPGKRVLAPPQTYIPTSARDSVTTLVSPSEGLSYKIDEPAARTTTRERQFSKPSTRPPVSYRDPTLGSNASKVRPVINTKAPLVNYSRPGGKFNSVGATHTTSDPPQVRSSTHSDVIGSFGDFNVDDYTRMYEDRFQNVVEISPISPTCAMPPTLPVYATDKSRRKWWQSREKKPETWMDQVVRSGSHNGMIVTDEVAAAPIVRY